MSKAGQATGTSLQGLEACIAYSFAEPGMLAQALTHSSAEAAHMERFEFLGDAVLGLAIAAELYRRFPEAEEGVLTRMRASLVCRDGLLQVAKNWRLDALLIVGPGERDGQDCVRSPSICANAVEAVIGAVFLDGGWTAARALVQQAWVRRLDAIADVDMRDAKTRLQEYTQAQGWGLPEYVVHDRGAGQEPRFTARCLVRGDEVGQGVGERKKTAESEAAKQACQTLNP